ncbi:MAG: hypothetical protein B7Z02_07570 [Rhodobacterales bacterium 32-67-9]|nr:MAG: hypothetical protein B7Z02_07570 [Rhodobacterales bacterium 32-67-9]
MPRIDHITTDYRPTITQHRGGLFRRVLARIVELDRRYREARKFAGLTEEQRRDMGLPPRADADGFYTTRACRPADALPKSITNSW